MKEKNISSLTIMPSDIEDNQSQTTRAISESEIRDSKPEGRGHAAKIQKEGDNKILLDSVINEEDDGINDDKNDFNHCTKNIVDTPFKTPVKCGLSNGEPRKRDLAARNEEQSDSEHLNESISLDGKGNNVTRTDLLPSEPEKNTSAVQRGSSKEEVPNLLEENNLTAKTVSSHINRDDAMAAENPTNATCRIRSDELLPFSPCSSTIASVDGYIEYMNIENSIGNDTDSPNKEKKSEPTIDTTTVSKKILNSTTMTPMMKTVVLNDHHLNDSSSNTTTDDFIKSGTRLRTLLDSAMRKVAIGFTRASDSECLPHAYYADDDDDDIGGYASIGCETSFETAQETDIGGETTDNDWVHDNISRTLEGGSAGNFSGHKRRRRVRSKENFMAASGAAKHRRRRQTTQSRLLKDSFDCDDDEGTKGGEKVLSAIELTKEKVAECISLQKASTQYFCVV
mmetsp:Transcript_21171/g.31162  ORF Transcript_21171/g.31162 Transcript_21171/m.31162 type:complete len:454 (+) Transcript_21171:333-1694(+)